MALAATTSNEATRRAAIESRLVSPEWPLRLPAVDTATGELRVFDKDSEVELVDAMSSSSPQRVPGSPSSHPTAPRSRVLSSTVMGSRRLHEDQGVTI
ncbi:hypothetical protein OG762_05885 [Streptomyces sp. NBC_01136]|uniref:hypothetical protein n=1 Tax=unclassified Streptomyces TaxID=2593676 RepID=UPI00324446B4|nr:hypothetical protein OG762_05885 [Streptomyces sp. NBC_01136]